MNMRNGTGGLETVLAILIALATIITEKESDGAISKYLGYIDVNVTQCIPCASEKKYPPIYTGVDYESR